MALGLSLAGSAQGQAVTLSDAVNEALDHNLDLAAEKWNVNVAEAKRITAGLRPNPVLTVSGQTLNVLGASYNSNSPLGPNQLVVHTDVPIERGRKRQDRVEVASEDQKIAELGVRETMRQVIFNTQSAFVDVQQAEQNLDLAEDNFSRLNQLVMINQSRLNSGDIADVEVNRSRVEASQAQAKVQQARLQVAQAKARLQLLLGRRTQVDTFQITGQLRRDSVVETEPELETLALTRRPDVQLAAGQQARTTADIRLQLANGKFDYVVGTDFVRQSAYGIAGNSMGFSFSMPLQIFNKNQGEIARAQRERSQADAKVVALQASVNLEVAQAYRQYTTARNLLETTEGDLLQRARSVRDTTEYAYQHGEASLIEFLDAQRAFNEVTQTYIDARASYARSLYQLDAASGAAVSAI